MLAHVYSWSVITGDHRREDVGKPGTERWPALACYFLNLYGRLQHINVLSTIRGPLPPQLRLIPLSVYPFYQLPIAEFTSRKMSKIRKELRLHSACDNIPKLLSGLTYK